MPNTLKTSLDPLATILQDTPEDVALNKKIQESIESKAGLEVAKEKEQATQKSIEAKGQEDVQKEYARKVEEDPLRAEKLGLIEKQKDTTFVPTKENVNDLAAVFTLTNLLGFMIGGKSKGNAQAALSAQNGMLEGHQKGLQDVYKREKDVFDENQKALEKTINALDKQLTENIQLYATDRDAGLAAIRTTLAEHNAKFLQDSLEKYGPAYMYDQLMNTKKVNDQLKQVKAKLYEHEETLQHQREMERQGQERLGYEQQRLELEKQKAAGLGKIDREILNEANKYYPELKPENLTNLSKQGIERITGGLDTIKSIESVADYIKQNPGAVGATAKIKNFINLDAIKSITGDDAASAQAKADVIDKQIDSAIQQGKITADDARSAKVLNKMLFAVALSDVRSTGQRGSIYLDKAFQGLYDQASRLSTLTDILHKRIEESNRRLGVVDMNVENRNDADKFPLTTQGSDAWMQQNFPVLTPAQIKKGLSDGSITNNMWFRGTDDIPRQINLGR